MIAPIANTVFYVLITAFQCAISGSAIWLKLREGDNSGAVVAALMAFFAIAFTLALYEAGHGRMLRLRFKEVEYARDLTASLWSKEQYAQVKHDRMDREGLEENDRTTRPPPPKFNVKFP